MQVTDIEFLTVCIAVLGLFCISCACMYALLIADKAYEYKQRGGYSWTECIVAAIGEYQ